MKICHISDTHGLHRDLIIPCGDLLVHSGDICNRGNKRELLDFVSWYRSLDYEYKVLVCGNHDFFAQGDERIFRKLLGDDVIYLKNEGIEIDGLKLWGSPLNREIGWAFGRSDMVLAESWKNIPREIDILITHIPPYSVLDTSKQLESLGDKELFNTTQGLKPKLHLFGHVHEARGLIRRGDILFSNGTSITSDFKSVLEPHVMEI